MVVKSMTVCSFKLKRKQSGNDFVCLNEAMPYSFNEDSGTFVDFIEAIQIFSNQHTNHIDDTESQKLFKCSFDPINKKSEILFSSIIGEVNSGAYGYESEITDQNGNVVHVKTPNEADVKKFMVLVYVPKREATEIKKGLLFFENIGQFGVKTITCKHLKEFFSERGYTLETGNIATQDYLNKILTNGFINQISYIKNNISTDSIDNLITAAGKEIRTFCTPSITEYLKRSIISFSTNRQSSVCEISNIQYDDIKFNITLNGKSKTFSLSNIDKMSLVESLPDRINRLSADTDDYRISIENFFIESASDYIQNMIIT